MIGVTPCRRYKKGALMHQDNNCQKKTNIFLSLISGALDLYSLYVVALVLLIIIGLIINYLKG